MIQVAILECDTPHSSIVEQHGDYFALFSRLLQQAGQQLKLSIQTRRFDCLSQQFPSPDELSTISCMLITGSKYDAYADLPWIVALKQFVLSTKTNFPAIHWLGICFGHQILAEALGGRCEPNPLGWEVGYTQLHPNEIGRQYIDRPIAIHEMHRDIVTRLPDDLECLASTEKCTNQWIRSKAGSKTKVMAIQAHPEFNDDIVDKIIQLRLDNQVFRAEDAQVWRSRFQQPLDGLWFIETCLKFFYA